MDKFLFEITTYYQGATETIRIYASDKEMAIKEGTRGLVKGVEILKVEQLSLTPAKRGTPKVC